MGTRIMFGLAAIATSVCSLSALAGPTLLGEDFEDGDHQGWLVNGNEMIFGGGNPGNYMGIPFDTFFGVTLRNETAGTAMTGDLSRHGGDIRFQVDVNVFALRNFFGNNIPPSHFPLTMQLVDTRDPSNFEDDVSAYIVGAGLPTVGAGWQTRTFLIPDPTSATLPAGWGGTGYEDPITFEQRLPDGVTYADVLASVDEFRITTFVPGFFYGFNFWEVGFDNINVTRVPAPASLALLGLAGLGARRRRD